MLKDLLIETWRGKSLARILMNIALGERVVSLKGRILDIGGGGNPSYLRYMDVSDATVDSVNIEAPRNPTYFHDLNEPFPIADATYDSALCINVIYCLRDPDLMTREAFRILRSGGNYVLVSPYVFNDNPEPEDYVRFTRMGLERLLRQAGFQDIQIKAIGGRASAAESLLDPIRLFYPIRIACRLWAIFLDRYILKTLDEQHPAPQAFLVTAVKK